MPVLLLQCLVYRLVFVVRLCRSSLLLLIGLRNRRMLIRIKGSPTYTSKRVQLSELDRQSVGATLESPLTLAPRNGVASLTRASQLIRELPTTYLPPEQGERASFSLAGLAHRVTYRVIVTTDSKGSRTKVTKVLCSRARHSLLFL